MPIIKINKYIGNIKYCILVFISNIINRFEKYVNKNIALWIIGSYYISVMLFAPFLGTIGGLNLSLFDYFTFIWILLIMSTKNSLRINIKYIKIESLLLILFTIYAGCETLYGMYGLKSLTLYLQLIRDIFIFILIYYYLSKADIIVVNRFIFKFAFYMGLLMLFLYGLFLTTGLLPIKNIFEYGEFHSIRFGGLAGDANFYGFLMSVAFLIGYYSPKKILNVKYKYFYMIIIGLNIVITISRSVIVVLVVTFIFTSLVFEKSISKKIKRLIIFFILLVVFLYVATIELPGVNISIYEWYALRATQSSPRFEMWMTLLGYIQEQPVFGYGLRASEIFLGGFGKFPHSSYIELLNDYGIIGFIMFVSFMFIVFLKGLKLIKLNSLYKGWLHSYIMICILFGGFTLLYWPFLWMLFAIILGGYHIEKSRFNNNILQ